MEERKRKLFFYSLAGDGGIEWEKAKKRRLNLFAGTGPGSSETRVQAVVKVFDLLQAAEPDEEIGRRNVLCMMARLNTNKTKNPTDMLRKAMSNKMATVATALVDPDPTDPTDLLSRFRRGRRPFQGNVEEGEDSDAKQQGLDRGSKFHEIPSRRYFFFSLPSQLAAHESDSSVYHFRLRSHLCQ